MAAILEQLDPELISLICTYLDVTSLSSLRLSSKSCKAKFTPEFLRYFETQNIDLTAHGLQRLCDLASSPGLSPGVRTLNLMCLYYHQQPSSEEVSRKTIIELTSPGRLYRRRENYHEPPVLGREQEEAWMAEKLADQAAFSGASMCHQLCQALSNLRTLDMIALEAAVICGLKQRRGPEEVKHLHWRKLWAQAIQAFRVVISAIACSQISLRSLIIYSRTKKYSIPTSEFTGQLLAKLQEEGFAKVGHSIGSFSISLATPVMPFRPATDQTTSSLEFYEPFDISCGQRLDASNPQVDPHANISGVARLLLYLTPKLESLNIHLYNTTTCTSSIPEERPYQDFLSSLFQNLSAPRLKSLTLHGMPVTMETMVDIFSQNRGLQFLSLENIFLTSGSWDRVLAEATQTCTSLSHVHLQNLWRPGCQETITNLDYNATASRRLDPSDPDLMPNWLHGAGDLYVWHTRDVKKEELTGLGRIEFDPTAWGGPFGVPFGVASGKEDYWRYKWRTECGPPTRHY